MKKFVFIVSLFTLGIAQNALAQHKFIIHTIKDGETLSALAKKHGTTVGDIMRLNGMNTDSKLSIGEKVKIPTDGKPVKVNVAATEHTATIAVPPANTNAPTPAKPQRTLPSPGTTHAVEKGETLWTIGKKYHLYVAEIKKWNNLQSNALKTGQVLQLSSQPAADQGSVPGNTVTQTTETTPAPQQSAGRKRNNNIDTPQPATSAPAPDISAGFFAPAYGKGSNGKSETTNEGHAMTFRTASGEADKKYYILMNDAPPGSVVKVSYGDKSVYAKVLWNLGHIKDNAGLDYRISNATATALGIDGEAFNISVSRYQ